MQPSDWINSAIAIFTAAAAVAALISARASREAVDQANQSAEENRKIAEKQTEALVTAAKANALASRINFYTEQIKPLKRIEERSNEPNAAGHFRRLSEHGEKLLDQLSLEREHLAHWLEQQTNELGVGLDNECPGSDEYNAIIRARNKPGA
jgi:hypothetical protein